MKRCTSIVAILFGASAIGFAQVQTEAPETAPIKSTDRHTPFLSLSKSPELKSLDKKLRIATSRLEKSKSEADRASATQEVRHALGSIYTARLDAYDEQLDLLEKKLQQMKQQVAKRRAAKDEMVNLRLKMIQAKASGFGWPDGPLPVGFESFWGQFGVLPAVPVERPVQVVVPPLSSN